MTALGILGPELIFQISFGQDFHVLGYSSWTMTHAWDAEMGGFFLHTSDCDPFPLNAAQLHYLVKENLTNFPKITKKAIDDKNMAEMFIRAITILQISWFVLNAHWSRSSTTCHHHFRAYYPGFHRLHICNMSLLILQANGRRNAHYYHA
jgi:hypothetical protein